MMAKINYFDQDWKDDGDMLFELQKVRHAIKKTKTGKGKINGR